MKLRNRVPSVIQVNPNSRRMFLKSAGGFALAIPLLPSLLTAGSEQALAAMAKPMRYVTLINPYGGLQHANWFGTNLPTTPFNLYQNHVARLGTLTSLAPGGALSPVINSNYANLLPYANMIAGSDQPYYFGHNRCVPVGAFARTYPGYTTPQDQADFSRTDFLNVEFPSVDQVVAYAGGKGIYTDGLAGRRRFLNVSVGMYGGGQMGSWGRDDFASNDPVHAKDAVSSTGAVFNYLFGNAQLQAQVGQGTNPILTLVNQFWPSGRALMSRLTARDRDSLDQFFQLASEASNDYAGPMPNVGGITAPPGTVNGWNYDSSNLNALADLIVLAFKADVTRVVTMHVESTPAGLENWHGYSHASGDTQNPNAGQPELVAIHKHIGDNLFARMGNGLLAADPFDSQSSILQNSLLQWTMENKMAHHNSSTPLFMLGGAGGRLNTNQFADLRNLNRPTTIDASGDQLYVGDIINRAYASMLYSMNIPRATYEVARGGTSPDTVALTKGYGHVFKVVQGQWFSFPDTDVSRVGEPWEFLVKAGTSWG